MTTLNYKPNETIAILIPFRCNFDFMFALSRFPCLTARCCCPYPTQLISYQKLVIMNKLIPTRPAQLYIAYKCLNHVLPYFLVTMQFLHASHINVLEHVEPI